MQRSAVRAACEMAQSDWVWFPQSEMANERNNESNVLWNKWAGFYLSRKRWTVTKQELEVRKMCLCCASSIETIPLRKINDVKFSRSCTQFLTGRGTVSIGTKPKGGNNSDQEHLQISTWGTKKLYRILREKCLSEIQV